MKNFLKSMFILLSLVCISVTIYTIFIKKEPKIKPDENLLAEIKESRLKIKNDSIILDSLSKVRENTEVYIDSLLAIKTNTRSRYKEKLDTFKVSRTLENCDSALLEADVYIYELEKIDSARVSDLNNCNKQVSILTNDVLLTRDEAKFWEANFNNLIQEAENAPWIKRNEKYIYGGSGAVLMYLALRLTKGIMIK